MTRCRQIEQSTAQENIIVYYTNTTWYKTEKPDRPYVGNYLYLVR